MPDKEKNTEKDANKRPSLEASGESSQASTSTLTTSAKTRHAPPWPLIALGAFATIVTIALIVVSWMLIASHRQTRLQLGAGKFGPGANGQYGNGGGQYFRRGGMRGGLQAVAARGVVTAVNGDTLTISGSGKQVTVNKANATITGDKTDVAVNDDVVVYGSTGSDGTVTATRIVVRNVSASGQATMDGNTDNSGTSTVPGA